MVRSAQKCQRPDCKRKGTVRLKASDGRSWLVCQKDVNWAYLQMQARPKAQMSSERNLERVEEEERGEEE